MKTYLETACDEIEKIVRQNVKARPEVNISFFLWNPDGEKDNVFELINDELKIQNGAIIPLVMSDKESVDLRDLANHFSSAVGASMWVMEEVLKIPANKWVFGFFAETFIGHDPKIRPSKDPKSEDGVIITAVQGKKQHGRVYRLIKSINHTSADLTYKGTLAKVSNIPADSTNHPILEAYGLGLKTAGKMKNENPEKVTPFVDMLLKKEKNEVLPIILIEAMKASLKLAELNVS